MKLRDLKGVQADRDQQRLRQLVEQFNDNRTDYPRDRTVHALFAEQAALRPDAPAILSENQSYSYRELDEAANRLAHFLVAQGLQPEECVAVLLDRPFESIAALLGILKAGGAYVPLDQHAPQSRLRHLLDETAARMLICEARHIRLANRLQWDCPRLDALLCADSRQIHGESEGTGEMMKAAVWDHVGRTMFDDISGGGWTSSYTGEWLSREVMDEYGDNIRTKLSPYLTPHSRVLEIGCSSGISMFRLAPLVGLYYGTDLSAEILRKTDVERQKRGLNNIRLAHLPAHEIGRLEAREFDVVVINSVIQCFSGHNYLRHVLRQAIDLLGDRGVVFLGNLWDQDRKDEFVQSLREFRQQHAGQGYRTKVDRSEELFVSRGFLEDLRHAFPQIGRIESSLSLGQARSELSDFGYDALLWIDKQQTSPPPGPRRKQQFDLRALEAASPSPPAEHAGPRSLAYVMYTSGSTGRPKGVMVEHRSIVRLVRETNYIQLGPDDRTLLTGPLAFDASTFEIWGPLLAGGAVCKPPERAVLDSAELARLIGRHRITTMWLTAPLFHHHADRDVQLFAGLKHLLAGGERVSAAHASKVRQAHPDLALINGYGPTENTTFTTCHRIDRDYEGDVPIGRPISNTQVLILDAEGRLTPIGARGEICAAGDGLARGYLGDAELTQARFPPHPFNPQQQRIYRTGDLGLWRADGTIEYLGRLDDQVKIRGYRIEPREIERYLLSQPLVSAAVVLARDFGGPSQELVAYVVAPADANLDAVRERLQLDVPEYMIPAHFVRLDQLPLNANGKVDRPALPVPAGTSDSAGRSSVPPATEVERRLLGVWEEVLGRRGLGVTDNFFDAGGHSLKVAKAVSLIEDRLRTVLPLTAFFARPTVRELAEHMLDQARFGTDDVDRPLVPLSPAASGPTVFLFPPGTGDALGFVQLASLLKPFRVYGFNFLEAESRLREYADAIADMDASGPHLVCGYSSGGNLAYHVAAELERRGRRVAGVVMIDSARKLRPMRFPDGEVDRIAEEFLNHESVLPLVQSPLLREKARRRIQRSYKYFESAVDHHRVAAPIHLLSSTDPVLEHHDSGGELLSSVHRWGEVCRHLVMHQGAGNHLQMLHQPYLDRNAELLQGILERLASAGRSWLLPAHWETAS